MERAPVARLNRLVGEKAEILGPPQRRFGHKAQRLARIQAFHHGNLIGPRLDSISDLVQDLASIRAGQCRPCAKSRLRGPCGGIDIGRIAARHLCKRFQIDG